MIKFFKSLWMKIKPKKNVHILKIGDKRIHNGEAQVLIKTTWSPKDGHIEYWEDLIKQYDIMRVINCPRCHHIFSGRDIYHGAEERVNQ